MDNVQVRTAEQLEKKYNLSKLAKSVANIEVNSKDIIHIQQELDDFIDATTGEIANLETQIDEKVDTYYYNGAPSLLNYPASSWEVDDYPKHVGDLYFDKTTGYTYRFENDSGYKWTRIKDSQITEAMSTANAAQDTADGKRRIFMSQPIPPYDNGDLWLEYNNGNPGDIKACQISKTQGQSFEDNDWIAASKYTDDTIANAIVTEMGGTATQVLSGQVVLIMDNYAKFTDLATGGSTEIAGENITTGNIKSSNYVAGTSGTNINLTTGKISTPNVNIDNDGIKLSNGAKVVGSNGLKNTYLYTGKSEKNFVGFLQDYFGSVSVKKLPNIIDISIPDGLEVTKAILHLYHSPVTYYIYDYDTGTEIFDTMGYVRNAKVYKASNIGSREIAVHTSEYDLNDTTTYTDTQITWYKNGVSQGASYTPVTPTQQSHNLEEVYTSDFSSLFKSGGVTIPGMYEFKVETSDAAVQTWDDQDIKARTGWCYAEIEIEGYMTYS